MSIFDSATPKKKEERKKVVRPIPEPQVIPTPEEPKAIFEEEQVEEPEERVEESIPSFEEIESKPLILKETKPIIRTEPTILEKEEKDIPEEISEVKIVRTELPESEVKGRLKEKHTDVEVSFEKLEPRRMPKIVMTIYGNKGEGKTWLALTLPGKKLLIDFDGQGKVISEVLLGKGILKEDEIYVVNGLKYASYDFEEQPISGHKTYYFLKNVLNKVQGVVDWIIFDNTEIYHDQLEKAMRYVFNLEPYQGIANRNVWKLRKAMMREIHYLALRGAKRGIVYTCYPEIESIIEGGEILHSKQKPKWIDIILYETNIIIRVKSSEGYTKFTAKIESSKIPIPTVFETGNVLDVTGEGFKKYFK